MDHMMELSGHNSGVTLENEIFTDLDFADDVAEMLEVLVLALSVVEEAAAFGLHINWSKTKIVQFCNPATCSTVQVADGQVEVVDSFVYLGSTIDFTSGSRGEILRRIGLARSCMNLLEKRI